MLLLLLPGLLFLLLLLLWCPRPGLRLLGRRRPRLGWLGLLQRRGLHGPRLGRLGLGLHEPGLGRLGLLGLLRHRMLLLDGWRLRGPRLGQLGLLRRRRAR